MRSKTRIEITQRDLGLLHFLHDYKVANLELISKYNFKTANKKIVSRRLVKLYQHGYIAPLAYIANYGAKVAFSLSSKGFSLLYHGTGIELHKEEFESGKTNHDLTLVEIGERFKMSPNVAEYVTENTLNTSQYYQKNFRYSSFCRVKSDAMLVLKGKDQEYFMGVEYEAAAKTTLRWQAKLYDYHLESNIHGVFYICETLRIKNKLEQIEKELCQKFSPKLYTALKKDVINDSGLAHFENPFGQTLTVHLPKISL